MNILTRALAVSAVALFATLAPVAPSIAESDDASIGRQQITTLVDEAEHSFGKDMSREEKTAVLRTMIEKYGDVGLSSEEVLGRYWAKATPEQQKEFSSLLVEYAIGSWVDQVGDIPAGEKVEFLTPESEGNGRILWHTRTSSPTTPPNDVDWTLARNADGRLAFIDVQVGGVSIIKAMHADFTAIIRSNGGQIEPLLDALRKKNAALKDAH